MGATYLQLHITNRCGNRCTHCYQKGYDGADLKYEDAVKVLKDFQDFSKKLSAKSQLAITGGDPFKHLGFWAILSTARKLVDKLAVICNPENIDLGVCKKFKEIGVDGVQMSLDGNERTHDAIRYPGSFDRTIRAIKLLAAHGIKVSVLSTVSADNLADMQTAMDVSYSAGASHWDFSRYVPCSGDCGINAKEYECFLNHITSLHARYEIAGYAPLSKEPLLSIIQKKHGGGLKGCSLGTAKFTMLPSMTLMACRRHDGSTLGAWTPEQNFLWHFVMNPIMKQFRDFPRLEKCKSCSEILNCRGCRAVAHAKHGDDSMADPQCFK